MAILLHALAALVLGNFRFASFFERAHSDLQIREPGFNHLVRCCATHFFVTTIACYTLAVKPSTMSNFAASSAIRESLIGAKSTVTDSCAFASPILR